MTPVIFGSFNTPDSFRQELRSYNKGELLHPPIDKEKYSSLPNGIKIDLPLMDTEAHIKEHLNWLPKVSDEELVNGLLHHLKVSSGKPNKKRGL